MRHESKCRHIHGHRYILDVTCVADGLDPLGRVIDFSVVKSVFGAWVDEYWDHGALLNIDDTDVIRFFNASGFKVYLMDGNPTAENIAICARKVADELLAPYNVRVESVRCYETPNCWSDSVPIS